MPRKLPRSTNFAKNDRCATFTPVHRMGVELDEEHEGRDRHESKARRKLEWAGRGRFITRARYRPGPVTH